MALKTIIFIRHAKSSWTDLSMRDYDRPLDSRGLKDAPVMASKLKALDFLPDLIISSGAKRAQETAASFASMFGLQYKIDENLYHAPPQAYLNVIQSLKEDISTVCLVGHNPGMTDIANLVEYGASNDLPTCGIVIAQIDEEKPWLEIDWDDMSLVTILTPKKS